MKPYSVIAWLALGMITMPQSSNDHQEFAYVRHEIRSSQSFIPRGGYVPDAKTAIAIAYAVALPIYGKKAVDAEKPLRTELKDGNWIVLGTLHHAISGGTLIVQIDQATGKILYLNHSM
jgi:hypothetical protein